MTNALIDFRWVRLQSFSQWGIKGSKFTRLADTKLDLYLSIADTNLVIVLIRFYYIAKNLICCRVSKTGPGIDLLISKG